MDDAVHAYVEAIAPARRPLFDRMHRLILEARPDADVVMAYKMPTYRSGGYSLHVAVWKHGLSLYGWDAGRIGGFAARHPDLVGAKGTIRIPTETAGDVTDDDLRELARGALGG